MQSAVILAEVHAEVIDHRRWGAPWHVIEIVRHGLNKAVGISHVSKWMDIPKERIIAFGDEDNDLEMIDYAGVGVAMGNGIDRLKSIADEVTRYRITRMALHGYSMRGYT